MHGIIDKPIPFYIIFLHQVLLLSPYSENV